MVGLTGLDLNLCARLIKYRSQAPATSDNSTDKEEKSSAVFVDEFGEIARRKITQPQKRLLNAEIDDIIEAYKNGVSTNALAKKYGCNRTTISGHLKKNGIKVTTDKIGSEEGVAEIISLYKGGLNTAEIAEQFKVSYTTILKHLHASGIQMRTRWDY